MSGDTLPMHLAQDGPSESYEDLLSQWSDLESGLGMLLAVPDNVDSFHQKVRQYDRWMQDLLEQDADTALYLLSLNVDASMACFTAANDAFRRATQAVLRQPFARFSEAARGAQTAPEWVRPGKYALHVSSSLSKAISFAAFPRSSTMR